MKLTRGGAALPIKKTVMSYRYSEMEKVRKLSETTESEQVYIRKEWERLCARENINNSENIFFQKQNGRFFKAIREHENAIRGCGSTGGYWTIRYGSCRHWGFSKDPFGGYYPDVKDKYYSALKKDSGELIIIPSSVHTKKETLELAKKLGFEF